MTNTTLSTVDTAPQILEEIRKAYFDIPFCNTQFQTEAFVIASQITPARAWRTIGLSMHVLINSIQSLMIEAEERQINIEEITEQLQADDLNRFDRRRKELKLKQLQSESRAQDKSLHDSLNELNFLYSKYKEFPQFSREEFEAQERTYFEQSLQRQVLGLTGAKEGLLNLGQDIETMKTFVAAWAQLSAEERHRLQDVAISSLAAPINLNLCEGE